MKRKYNWHPDLPDHRDYAFAPKAGITITDSTDLRPHMTPVEDQKSLGSCTANAGVALVEYLDKLNDGHYHNYSRLFLYYNERALRGETKVDSGAYIRDVCKALANQGVCTETLWKYTLSQFATKPSAKAYADGAKRKALQYMRVNQDSTSIRTALAQGLPVIFGFSVYDSFESAAVAKTGIVPMPGPNESLLGGHAVAIVGHDDKLSRYVVRNSWGTGWGMKGYFTMPYDYVHNGNLAEDFWVLQKVNSL